MNEHAMQMLAALAIAGGACQFLAWKLRLPAILFLLLTGIVAGPVAGWLDRTNCSGPCSFPSCRCRWR